MRRLGREAGQASTFLVGVVACGLSLFGLASDGTRLLLAHRDLQHAVDAAALAGASALDEDHYRRLAEPRLDGLRAEAAARRALDQAGLPPDALVAVRVDGSGVEVRAWRGVRLPLLGLARRGADGVGARAFARPVLRW